MRAPLATPPRAQQRQLLDLLDLLVPIPDESLNLAEAYRWRHWDVPRLPLEELAAELRRVRWRLDFDPDPHPWLVTRLVAVRAALTQRQEEHR